MVWIHFCTLVSLQWCEKFCGVFNPSMQSKYCQIWITNSESDISPASSQILAENFTAWFAIFIHRLCRFHEKIQVFGIKFNWNQWSKKWKLKFVTEKHFCITVCNSFTGRIPFPAMTGTLWRGLPQSWDFSPSSPLYHIRAISFMQIRPERCSL